MFYLIYKIYSSFSKIERLIFIGALLVLALSLIFFSWNFYYSATEERPANGGEFIEGLVGQPAFINPLVGGSSDVDRDLMELLFSNLLDIVEDYQISPDNKIWSITLKKDLFWDDGERLTANDVIFTIETIKNPDAHSPLFPTWQGVAVEKLNDDELRFTLKDPYAFFIDNLRSLKVAPKHIFDIPPANLRLSKYNLEPVGAGPYKFEKFTAEKDGFVKQIVLRSNIRYHERPPFIQKLTFNFYRTEDELIKAFNKKEIDGLGGIDPAKLGEIKIKHNVFNFKLPRYYAIFFNPSSNPLLQDLAIREALNLATNKKLIVNEIFGDYASLTHGPIPTEIKGFEASVYQDASFSKEEAEKILEESGWLTSPEDGLRYKTFTTKTKEPLTPQGRVRLEFEMIIPEIPFLIRTADIIKKDWEEIGIKLVPIILNVNDINKSILQNRDYQIIIFGNILKPNPDVFAFWHSSARFFPGLNLALYNNKKVDALLESIRQDINLTSQKENLKQLQEIIFNENPAVFLYSPNYIYLTNSRLRGLDAGVVATPANRFEKAKDWYLKTERDLIL